MIYYWILMLSRAVDGSNGLPMHVYTSQSECEAKAAYMMRDYKPDAEMRWHCLGVVQQR